MKNKKNIGYFILFVFVISNIRIFNANADVDYSGNLQYAQAIYSNQTQVNSLLREIATQSNNYRDEFFGYNVYRGIKYDAFLYNYFFNTGNTLNHQYAVFQYLLNTTNLDNGNITIWSQVNWYRTTGSTPDNYVNIMLNISKIGVYIDVKWYEYLAGWVFNPTYSKRNFVSMQSNLTNRLYVNIHFAYLNLPEYGSTFVPTVRIELGRESVMETLIQYYGISNAGYLINQIYTNMVATNLVCENSSKNIFNPLLLFRTLEDIVTTVGWYAMFVVGVISQTITIDIPVIVPVDSGIYWTYISWELNVASTEDIIVGDSNINWSYSFNITSVDSVEEKFYYDDYSDTSDWGDWGIFNFLRDFFHFIVGFFWVIIQYIGYILTVLAMTVLWGVLLDLIGLLIWNILVYWLIFAIMWAGFALVWVLINLPVILSTVIAVIVAGLIYAFSFGTLDFYAIYDNINKVVLAIVNAIVEYASVFFIHIDSILLFTVGYLTLIGLLYLKIFYCRGRGYTNRAKKLQDSLGSYMKPVKLVVSVISKLKEAIMPTTGGAQSD